jgi:hypothetical protein
MEGTLAANTPVVRLILSTIPIPKSSNSNNSSSSSGREDNGGIQLVVINMEGKILEA